MGADLMLDGWALWEELRARGVRLRVEGDRLMAGAAGLTPELREDLERNRDYIKRLVLEEPQGKAIVAPFEVRWAKERGWVKMRDPFTGEWHYVPSKGLPRWVYKYLTFKTRRYDDAPSAE